MSHPIQNSSNASPWRSFAAYASYGAGLVTGALAIKKWREGNSSAALGYSAASAGSFVAGVAVQGVRNATKKPPLNPSAMSVSTRRETSERSGRMDPLQTAAQTQGNVPPIKGLNFERRASATETGETSHSPRGQRQVPYQQLAAEQTSANERRTNSPTKRSSPIDPTLSGRMDPLQTAAQTQGSIPPIKGLNSERRASATETDETSHSPKGERQAPYQQLGAEQTSANERRTNSPTKRSSSIDPTLSGTQNDGPPQLEQTLPHREE